MHDVEAAGGKPVALAARILGEMELDLEAAPLEDPLRDAGVQRQGLGLRKGIDAQHRRLVGARGGGDAEREHAQRDEDLGETTHEPLPARLRRRTIAIIAAWPAPRPRSRATTTWTATRDRLFCRRLAIPGRVECVRSRWPRRTGSSKAPSPPQRSARPTRSPPSCSMPADG